MKALITAFALLSFVAATSIPLAAQAQTQNSTQTTQPAKAKKKSAKKAATKKVAHKKKTSAKKMKKPSQA